MPYAVFETEHRVRPDDIDMFSHVHNSKYFDYVLAARYEQMDVCYGMSMETFLDQGFGWVVRSVQMDFKRPLAMGDYFLVKTGIATIDERGCRVHFSISNKATKKVCCDGWFDFSMIEIATGKAVKLPQNVIAHYQM